MPVNNKLPLQRRSKALTQMRTWISCHLSLLASWVLYAGSINMTNAVDSLNVENNVERSRCPTALASHAGIPEPIVLRFEEGGGSLPPHGSLWREEYLGGSASRSDVRREPKLPPGSLPTKHEALPRADPRSLASVPEALWRPYSAALGSPQRSWGRVSASPDTYRGVLWPAGGSSLLHSALLASIGVP